MVGGTPPAVVAAVAATMQKSRNMDEAEARILELPPVECPLTHGFANGYYLRTILMPKNAMVASAIHNTRHPYWVTKGVVLVEIDGVTQRIVAPHVGITEPGTRRLLFIEEETEWTTFHHNPTNEHDISKLESLLTEFHVNAVLGVAHADVKKLHLSMHADSQSLTAEASR